MALDLTPVVKAEMMIERLNMPDDYYVSFIENDDEDGDVERLRFDTTTTDYDWDAVEVQNLYVAVNFVRLRVIDFDGFEEILAKCEKVEINGEMFSLKRLQKPFGVTRVWTFKCEEMTDL